MIRNVARAAIVLLTALVMPVAVVAAALPASAASSGALCEVSGHSYCINTANFNLYTPVTESGSGARTIDAVLQSGANQTYLLVFHGDTSGCVAGSNNGTAVEVKACDGSTGVIWTLNAASSGDLWINDAATRKFGVNIYLTGNNSAGTQYFLAGLGFRGANQKFKFYSSR